MSGRRVACAVVVLSIAAAPAVAQSLGELARQEEARRATTAKKAVKTLSNADLDPSAIVAPARAVPAEPACYMSKTKGRCVSAEEMVSFSVAGNVTRDNAPFEPTIRSQAAELRTQIEGTRQSIATLEGVVADAGRSASDRKAAEKTLLGARQALADLERRWTKLEIGVSNQRLPREWLEPIPTLTTKTPQ